MRLLCKISMAVLLATGFAASASAQQIATHELTLVTFDGPVRLPGIVLPAGTYQLTISDPQQARHQVTVRSEDGQEHFGTFIVRPYRRTEPDEDTVLMYSHSGEGPAAVKAWFYPGNVLGHQFVYSMDEARSIASGGGMDVLAVGDDDTVIVLADGEERPWSDPSGEAEAVGTTGAEERTDAPVTEEREVPESESMEPRERSVPETSEEEEDPKKEEERERAETPPRF